MSLKIVDINRSIYTLFIRFLENIYKIMFGNISMEDIK